MEPLRDNPYPDVLIRLLIAMIDALDDELKSSVSVFKRHRPRGELKALRERLEELLHEAPEYDYSMHEQAAESESMTGSASVKSGTRAPGAAAHAQVASRRDEGHASATSRSAQFTKSKIEGLRSQAVDFQKTLDLAVKRLGSDGLLVIIDDFYYIPMDDQPAVLAYLHQVVKNLRNLAQGGCRQAPAPDLR